MLDRFVPRLAAAITAATLIATTQSGTALAAAGPTHVSAHLTPSTVHVGAVFVVSGMATPKIKGSTVVVERLVGKSWTSLGHTKTSATGTYALNVRAPKTASRWAIRVVRTASADAKAGVSAVVHETITKAVFVVTVSAAATTAPSPVVVTGSVIPKATGVVELQLLQSSVWHNVASAHLTAHSTYAISLVRPVGSYRLRVVKAFSATVAAGNSGALTAVVAAPVVAPAPAIVATHLAGGEVGRPYSQTLTATGGTAPLVWSATSLPGGLTMSPAGVISGRPTGVTTASVVITVLDAIGRTASTTQTLVIVVASGTVVAWGAGTSGELGNGTSSADSNVPVPVSSLTLVTAVAGATYSEYALRSDGTVWSWGHDDEGQLGTGLPLADRSTPTQIPDLAGVTAIAGGFEFAAALKADGTVWTWGWGTAGELGNGAGVDSSTPVQVSNLTGVVAIALGDFDGYALKADGTVWAWGDGADGQLGDGVSTSNALVPLKITGLPSAVTAIAASADGAYAVIGGTVMTWGKNSQGELGDGSKTPSRTPEAIAGLTGVTAISAGYFDGYALHADGSLTAWGMNSAGELGNGLTTTTLLPATVPGLLGVTAVEGRASDVSVLKPDGTVMTWGENGYGGLGNGTAVGTNSLVPVVVPALSGVMALAVGPVSITGLAIIAQ